MADPTPLIVSIPVEALVVNQALREKAGDFTNKGYTFLRAPMHYVLMSLAQSAEPNPFVDSDSTFTTGPSVKYDGVYLQWRLPTALMNGMQDSGGNTEFPMIPNRWLVARFGGDAPACWIIQSDAISPTLSPKPATLSATPSLWSVTKSITNMATGSQPTTFTGPSGGYIGANTPLANGASWTEPGGPAPGLTAMAPGNPAFLWHQVDSNNVLSFIDPIGATGQAAATFSYLVVGWYGGGARDILADEIARAGSLSAALETLKWERPSGLPAGATADYSLYAGLCTGVAWQTGSVPNSQVPALEDLMLAVGPSTAETITALVSQLAARKGVNIDATLIEAFQLDQLVNFDSPDYQLLLARAVEAARFQKSGGRYQWQIDPAPGTAGTPSADELDKETAWLAALNNTQAALDTALLAVADLRDQLYVQWWKLFSIQANGESGWAAQNLPYQSVYNQLDPEGNGLAAQLQQQLSAIAGNANFASIPSGATAAALSASIAAYAARQGLPANRVLRRVTAPASAMPGDPVIAVAGAGADDIASLDAISLCRFASDLVTGIQVGATQISTATVGLSIPKPDLSQVSGVPWSASLIEALATELFFLDSGNADAIAAAVPSLQEADIKSAMTDFSCILGTPPTTQAAFGGWTWESNPWRPLFLAWSANYYPLSYGSDSAPNWVYDGTAYHWQGKGAAQQPLTLSGRIVLGPSAAYNLYNRVAAYLQTAGSAGQALDTGLKALETFLGTSDLWDILSQSLDGFSSRLLARAPGAYPSPGGMTNAPAGAAALIGTGETVPPQIGTPPTSAPGNDGFQPWRAGQFYFTNLAIIDCWGQAIQFEQSQPIIVAKAFRPDDPVVPPPIATVVQLPPGILQPAQLQLQGAGATEIAGWLLPIPLEGALAVYDGDGKGLGELSVGATATGQAVVWSPLPDSSMQTLADCANIPIVGPLVQRIATLSPQDFAIFLAAVDETGWTSLPDGDLIDQSLADLIGRPVAIVSAQLSLTLDGAVASDPGWANTPPLGSANGSDITSYSFPVQLGGGDLADGLIGYFAEGDYTIFNIVPAVETVAPSFMKKIGADGNFLFIKPNAAALPVTLLLDPRAPVHILSGFLPATNFRLPAPAVAAALDTMEVALRYGPVLLETGAGPAGTAFALPVPGASGNWAWMEDTAGSGWVSTSAVAPDMRARLPVTAARARRGWLKLTRSTPPARKP